MANPDFYHFTCPGEWRAVSDIQPPTIGALREALELGADDALAVEPLGINLADRRGGLQIVAVKAADPGKSEWRFFAALSDQSPVEAALEGTGDVLVNLRPIPLWGEDLQRQLGLTCDGRRADEEPAPDSAPRIDRDEIDALAKTVEQLAKRHGFWHGQIHLQALDASANIVGHRNVLAANWYGIRSALLEIHDAGRVPTWDWTIRAPQGPNVDAEGEVIAQLATLREERADAGTLQLSVPGQKPLYVEWHQPPIVGPRLNEIGEPIWTAWPGMPAITGGAEITRIEPLGGEA